VTTGTVAPYYWTALTTNGSASYNWNFSL
jgi:hypothetical protein